MNDGINTVSEHHPNGVIGGATSNAITDAQYNMTHHPYHLHNVQHSSYTESYHLETISHSYDPNMCTTAARFINPFYESIDQHTYSKEDIATTSTVLSYKNIILVHETTGIGAEAIVGDDGIANETQYHENILQEGHSYLAYGIDNEFVISNHSTSLSIQPSHYEREIDFVDNDRSVDEVPAEVTGIFIHRSPNGHIYQDYFVSQNTDNDDESVSPADEFVELVQIQASGKDETDSTLKTEQMVNMEIPVSYSENSEIIEQFAEHLQNVAHIPTTATLIENEITRAKEIADKFQYHDNLQTNSRETETGHIIDAHPMLEKDHQRVLLESTMSPLLAAVNDITQRDAELQSQIGKFVAGKNLTNPENSQIFSKSNIANRHIFDKEQFKETGTFIDSSEVITIKDDLKYSSEEDTSYLLVADKPVESRARASLPTNYLYFGNIPNETNEPSVFAKKPIPKRTKFGPFKGDICSTINITLESLRDEASRHYPILLIGGSSVLVVTNENTSNWMRFVRLAKTFSEQNLQLLEEDDKIYFKCCRDIRSKEELRVGYHKSYADRYGLIAIQPSAEDCQQIYETDNPWKCFECDERFHTSEEVQKHLNVHDVEDVDVTYSPKRRRRKRKKLKTLSEIPKNSSRCSVCHKVFMTNASLKKHFATHITAEKRSPTKYNATKQASMFKCNFCHKKFLSVEKCKNHQLSHSVNEQKPYKCSMCDQYCATPAALAAHIRSHTNRLYTCVYCQKSFKYVVDFKHHVGIHMVDGVYFCTHCNKEYKEYHLVRKHVRIFHPAVKYPCNECDRLFLHISFLRRHKATHLSKKEFLCSECGHQFSRKDKLKDHIKAMHSERGKERKARARNMISKKKKSKTKPVAEAPPVSIQQSFEINSPAIGNNQPQPINDGSQYLKLSPEKPVVAASLSPSNRKQKTPTKKLFTKQSNVNLMTVFESQPKIALESPCNSFESLDRVNTPPPEVISSPPIITPGFPFKCTICPNIKFKRRGVLVNHMAKFHPEESIDSVENLNQPIFKVQSIFYCPYCSKVYKSNAKRKEHILKNHPGEKLPPSIRSNPDEAKFETIGSVIKEIQKCHLCPKQYGARNRLSCHYRKAHPNVKIPEPTNPIVSHHLLPQNLIEKCFDENIELADQQIIEPEIDIVYQPLPSSFSQENKLLKLSSAALELSSIEDRKFFDFLNERCATVAPDHTGESLDDSDITAVAQTTVQEFVGENLSNNELNRLPELFEESIACIKI